MIRIILCGNTFFMCGKTLFMCGNTLFLVGKTLHPQVLRLKNGVKIGVTPGANV